MKKSGDKGEKTLNYKPRTINQSNWEVTQMKAQKNSLTGNLQPITSKFERSNKMKRNLLLLAMMVVAALFFTPRRAGGQCPADPNDLGICDTLYVETFDCDHEYEANPGSFDLVRVAIYVTHDSNTFWYDVESRWVQDSIRAFAIPLYFWHQPPGCADSVILPNWDNWNNTAINPDDPRMSWSIFRHIVDTHTGDTTYNRLLQMVENGKLAWDAVLDIESHSSDGDSGQVFLAPFTVYPACQPWWEGSRELLATLTFQVYMSDTCDTTEICFDSTFRAPLYPLSFYRYDAVGYCPRHFLPVRDTIYRAVNDPPVVLDIPDQSVMEGENFASIKLDDYVGDPDDLDQEMNWTHWGEVELQVNVSNRVVTITVPDPEWSGSETIWFKACDPCGLCDSNEATFTVTAVNDTPVVSDIPNQTILQTQSFASINLDNYVDDPDNPDDQMVWTHWGEDSLLVDISNRVATITLPNPGWTGSETILFQACDPDELCDSDGATFTVIPIAPAGFTYIPNVPDWNQPPLSLSANYCAPVAALNIVDYFPFTVWGLVDPADAPRYPDTSYTADLIGWFMGTNGAGSPNRANNPGSPMPGTYFYDQDVGLAEYIAWNTASQFPTPFTLPPFWKVGWTNASVGLRTGTDIALWQTYVVEIDSGRPVKVDFDYWNPILSDSFVDIFTLDTFYVYDWGPYTNSSSPPNPPEQWEDSIGHAVTGVGYIPNWNGKNWAIVHDNWPPCQDMVISWTNLMALITVYPPRLQIVPPITNLVHLPSHSDHCATSSFEGLDPPGGMGIWSLSNGKNLYFPSDSIAPPGDPQAWLTSGVQVATVYGPANVNITRNPLATVPDRNSVPCSLFVQIAPDSLIDEATDLNAIQISSGESKTISIDDTVETMVFLASCDGDYGSSPDQPLEVQLNYDDGTVESVVLDSIHPAGRGDINNPAETFIYGNEVFVCNPAYFDDPPSLDPYHSETWHWYALYPDNTKLLDSLTFVGIQSGPHSEVYILAVSYSTPLPPTLIRGDANGDGSINIADASCIINYLFIGGPAPDPLWVGDANSDGSVNIADASYLINYLFIGGPPPGEGRGMSPAYQTSQRYKGKTPAQIGLSSAPISNDGILNVPVIGKFDVDVSAVQLEIKYDPEEISLSEPALTPRTQGLTICSSSHEGIGKIGIIDLNGEHYISAGTGALVTLRVKGSDWSSRFASLTTSLEITKAILVDRDAHTIPVEILSEMKKSEEDFILGKSAVPQEFSLSRNYPNPFNPETEISYGLPRDCDVKLTIYNIAGQKVRTLIDQHQTAGYKVIHWNGKDEQGKPVASGVYFYKIQAGDLSQSRKMLLVK